MRGKPRLSIQDVATHVAEYYAETSPTERRICERAFPEWFRYYADQGCPLAKELLSDPNWMRRFPVTFNNAGAIDVDFIRSRLAVPPYLSDERDIFWRVRTNALGDVAQYLDAAYEKAVTWDSGAERDILADAVMTVAKRNDWSASVQRETAKLWASEPHAIGATARQVLDYWVANLHVSRPMLSVLSNVLECRPAGVEASARAPVSLDALFKQVPEAERYLRERARQWHNPRGQ
jgi:hypothetical protein